MNSLLERSDAVLSDCGRYRYTLSRWWADGPRLAWVMLNPSTADAEVDDPTIRRVRGFTQRLGFPGFTVVNLFALRATDPKALLTADDPIGPLNTFHMAQVIWPAPLTIAGWGAVNPRLRCRAADVVSDFNAGAGNGWHHLGDLTKDGHPRHPLYLPADAPLRPWATT